MAESAPEVTMTLDLEDPRPDAATPARYPEMTRRLLRLWDSLGVTATVFVVGTLARNDPGLIGEIAHAGHEIALHSFDHTPLTALDDAAFRRETEAGKKRLEDLTGRRVAGYRAPAFSLTAGTAWAADALAELGFVYSSSVLPAANPLYGFPGAPQTPFRWPSGLLEFPVPVARLGPFAVPYLGGVYLRLLPLALIRHCLSLAPDGVVPWIYCRPYDFDADDAWFRVRGTSWLTTALLRLNRRGAGDRLYRLLAGEDGPIAGPPFARRLRDPRASEAPVFSPGADAGEE